MHEESFVTLPPEGQTSDNLSYSLSCAICRAVGPSVTEAGLSLSIRRMTGMSVLGATL
jgi:hypothetical protein